MEIIQDLIVNKTQEDSWDTILHAILEKFSCTTGTIHFIHPADGLLHISSHAGIPEHILPMVEKIPVGKGIAGAAAEKKEAVEICNLQSDTSGVAKPAAKDTKVSGSVAVPILHHDGSLLGTLGIGKFEPYSFTSEEKDALTELASAIGAAA